ncbi:MAG: hypothetical protein H6577_26665 [Lewinellaceae bacterium]|nr:hypothetical protein [Saprospiraceae bacterium]MCB9341725.1 hypothetical protein [Lewinellaceae bacterium]
MKNAAFILTCSLFLLPLLGLAQNEEGMLIYQIDGNRYYRKNYDENNKLISYQSIEVGSLKTSAEKVEAKLTVITYDANDNMKGASQTVITCDPKASEVMMGIFPFAGGATNKSLKIELPKDGTLYPKGWREKAALEDYTFQLNFEGGAAGFFGTESSVSFSGRKVSQPREGVFRIAGKMTLKAYVLGIKISTIKYDYSEDFEKNTGIVRQKFTEGNGNYFTVEIKK